MTRTTKIVGGLLAVFAVLLVVLVIVIATFDWNRLKPTINERASEALGRPFAINGDLSVRWARSPTETGWRSWFPWPHVTAHDITLGNLEWARTDQFATLERADFSVSPLPLLVQRVVIRDIQLTKPWADLQRMKDGRANWTFAMKEDEGKQSEPSSWLLDINSVGFDQGRVGYADEALKADLEVLIDPLGKPIPYAEIVGDAAEAQSDAAVNASGEKGERAKQGAEKQAAEKQAAAKQPADKQAVDKQAAEKQTAENRASAKQDSGKQGAEKQSAADAKTDRNAADARSSEKDSKDSKDGKDGKDGKDSDDVEQLSEPDRTRPVADYVFGWKVSGTYNGQKLTGDGKIGGMLTLRDSDVPFPVQADLRVGRTSGGIAGTVTDPLNFGGLDLKLRLAGTSMADLFPLIGVTLPDTPPYKTDGRLIAQLKRPEGARYEYRGFNGAVGKSDLHGSLTYEAFEPRPKLTGRLRSDQLRLEDLGPLVGVQSGGAKAPPDADKKQPSDKVLPVIEFRTDRWNAMDADVRLTAGRIIHSAKLPLSKLNVHAVMDNGKLTLDPLNFGMAGGSIITNIHLNGAVSPMQGRANIRARDLRLQQLFADASSMQKSLGRLNGDMALAGAGNAVADLLATSNGEIKLLINDGVISRSLMEIAGLNVGNYVISRLFGDEEVQINCGAADLGVKQGFVRTNAFLFDTENALISVDGSANLRTEELDLDITPKSKGVRIFSLRSPLYVRGTFKDPKAGVQPIPLAARGAGMVALGALLTPVAGVLALIAPSAGEEEGQCAGMLAQLKNQPVKARSPSR